MSLEQKLIGILIEPSHEKFTPYLYLDPFGFLIYGNGQDLGLITKESTFDEMTRLVLFQNGKVLGPVQVRRLYKRLVDLFETNKSADNMYKVFRINLEKEYFRDQFGVFVNMDNAHSKLREDVKAAISASRNLFGVSMFDSLPIKVQLAIALLHYRLGLRRFRDFIERETNFKTFIELRKWRDAGILIDNIKAWQDRSKGYACNLLLN